jgi:hypothetical protein
MKKKEPKIGIWWYWQGTVFDFSLPVSEAEQTEGFSDSPESHVDTWSKLQKTNAEFTSLDYPDIPRGRVVWIKNTGFVLYASTAILREKKTVKAILKKFSLDQKTTALKPDKHYEDSVRRDEIPEPHSIEDEMEEYYDEFPELKDD